MTPTIVKAESGYIKDPLALFYELTQGTKNNILLFAACKNYRVVISA